MDAARLRGQPGRTRVGIDERDEIVLLRQTSDDRRKIEVAVGNVKENHAAGFSRL